MFTPEEREQVRSRLLDHAREDERISAAAIIGSAVTGAEDRWSDLDLTFGVTEPVEDVLADWGEWVEREFGALHHWGLPWGSTMYRVFLLPSCLQVDLSFTPAAQFGDARIAIERGRLWQAEYFISSARDQSLAELARR